MNNERGTLDDKLKSSYLHYRVHRFDFLISLCLSGKSP